MKFLIQRNLKSKIVLFLILIIFAIFLIRAFSKRQVDDVTPGIFCDKNILETADVFYVIPKFENQSISLNKSWCEEIISMNKTLALHGVYHTFKEFSDDKSEDYLQEGIKIFQECFNQTPEKFKPPQLKISEKNKILVEKNMKLDLYFNQIFHKVYHCNDSGFFPNWLIRLF